MIVSLLVLLGKILAALITFLLIVCVYHHVRARARISRLLSQGMTDYPTNGSFFFGMATEYMRYGKMVEANAQLNHPAVTRWLLDEIEGSPRRFNS